jgi:MFS family permease
MLQRFRGSGRAFAAVARSPNLLRMQLSFGAGWTAEWAFTVALGILAYRNGGAAAVGLISFLRMAPPALLAPLASTMADRFARDRVLVWSSLLRAVATALAAVVLLTGGPIAATYALATLAACIFILFRAAHSALLPALCGTPLELTSAIMARGLVDSVSTLVGPLLAGLLLSITTVAVTFLVVAALAACSGLLLVRLPYEPLRRVAHAPLRRLFAETVEGFRAISRHRDAALLIGLALVQTFTRGCLLVFLVVIGFDLLETGQIGVALLTAAVGAGATVGSMAALFLVSGRRLAVIQGFGVALWGLPLVLCGALPDAPLVVGLMAVIGIGNALVDVGLFTLLARLVPENLLGRVFGTLESLIALTVAVGSLITPAVIAVLGLRGALVAVGVVAPLAVAFAWSRLRVIDRSIVIRNEEITVLKQVDMLAPLPMPMIENLATHVSHETVSQGRDVFAQGETGDRFYVIEHGQADVIGDGRLIRTLGPGDCFGEIALLRETPRTATVHARTALQLSVLDRADFLIAVGGYSASARGAQGLLDDRLTTFTPQQPAR